MIEYDDRFKAPTAEQALSDSLALHEFRSAELIALQDSFEDAMAIVTNQDELNAKLAGSSRPDLVIAERAHMRQIYHPLDYGFDINNFVPSMTNFGTLIVEDETEGADLGAPKLRPLTDDDLLLWFELGGRGGALSYEDYEEIAQTHGLEVEQVCHMFMMTCIGFESFMRMWIVAPELTVRIMRKCLNPSGIGGGGVREEIFVAYTLMSQLVDVNDTAVKNAEGKIYTLRLIR